MSNPHEANGHPLIDVEIAAASHAFRARARRVVDSADRVERFEGRYDRGPTLSAGCVRQKRAVSGRKRAEL
ncbi:hypothetical protein GCM10011579_030600 [Streptomyces albiflavescens]|uniref:Uncharacterized protein n=1 Tax=Streptomyces albiflavescens TaxID=1623582 RepID=A0A918D363_9ACTN|nr:50S ribosomal protein L31 [Streptomyces albiflavescens]GGN62919.1 hypothetical protein GCM10011579_030600 [Streptomyces albiflavescens]